jgi:hypothetical protein
MEGWTWQNKEQGADERERQGSDSNVVIIATSNDCLNLQAAYIIKKAGALHKLLLQYCRFEKDLRPKQCAC